MKHKKLFITISAILTFFIALGIFLAIWYWGDEYEGGNGFNGFENFRKEIAIPGLDAGACPQGIANIKAEYTVASAEEGGEDEKKTQEYFFISAYIKGAPSRIYVVGGDTGYEGYVTLKNTDGSDFYGHCGGIATNGYTVWVGSDTTVYVAKSGSTTKDNIAYDIIKGAKENGSVTFTEKFNANCHASFCYFYNDDGDWTNYNYYNDRLYVGEFHQHGSSSYETNLKHHLETPNGDKNGALVFEYNISTSSSNKYGLETLSSTHNVSGGNMVPRIQKIYSVGDEVQGFARTKTGVVLSVSYGLKNSELYYYGWDTVSKTSKKYSSLKYLNDKGEEVSCGAFEYDGVYVNSTLTGQPSTNPYRDNDVYVYFIDGAAQLNRYSIPSMSEGLCVSDDRVYVLFESGAKKYRTFVRQILDNVYSFIPRSKK